MLTVILAICVILIGVLFFLKGEKTKEKKKSIPGPKRNQSDDGSFDLQDYSSQSEYLESLHKKYGPLVSFWRDDEYSVSIASPELMKETKQLSEVTLEINEPFRNLIGDDSLIFLNGEEANKRRKMYDQFFMLKAITSYFNIMTEIAEELVKKWKSFGENDPISIQGTIDYLSIKSILRTSFGDYFTDDEKLNSFMKEYRYLLDNVGVPVSDSSEDKTIEAAKKILGDMLKKTMDVRREELKNGAENRLFIDVLLDNSVSEGQRNSDALVMFAGADTVAYFFMWTIYELAKRSDIQEKVYEELQQVVGSKSITRADVSKLKYLRQVIDECLRYYFDFHTGRIAENDMTIGGYFIPNGTKIYQHLGVCLKDSKSWKDPDTFDPEHFNAENTKNRSAFAFKPFGCSGKRTCPGTTYSYFLMATFIAIWIQNFKLHLVPDQKFDLTVGFFKKPNKDLYFTVSPRQ